MFPIFYFVLLLSCSVLTKSEKEAFSVWSEPESETLNSLMANYGNHLMKWKPNIVFCCVCQEAVRQAKGFIYHKIQVRIHKACSIYIPFFRKKCLQRAGQVRDRIMQMIFPGGSPRGTCSKIRLCS